MKHSAIHQIISQGGEEIPAGTFHGGEEIPAGTFHGGEEIPAGTFHAGLVQCPKCKHWFARDSYRWRTHSC
ncbi:MAG: hypothetical protein LBK54_07235 [Propionibacteriaceae bacterium]|jgi:hypothetical protein|nr:hypothetical protein [Propionibacteriaceae bacterium]